MYYQRVGNMGCAALVEEMLKRIGMLIEEAEELGAGTDSGAGKGKYSLPRDSKNISPYFGCANLAHSV